MNVICWECCIQVSIDIIGAGVKVSLLECYHFYRLPVHVLLDFHEHSQSINFVKSPQ